MRPSLRAYGLSLAILTLPFAAWTYFIVLNGEDSHSPMRALAVASAVFIGPFTGPMSRDWQGCCVEFALYVLPYAAAFLGGGIGAQFLPLPLRGWAQRLKLALWGLGIFGWYASGIFSFLHALS